MTRAKAEPKRSLTDETIASMFNDPENSMDKVHTTLYIPKKYKNLAARAAKNESMTLNAYLLRAIVADLRRNGYIE